jgi:hypothetical protein
MSKNSKLKRARELAKLAEDKGAGPVKQYKPKDSKPEPAEECTIAVTLLRKHKELYTIATTKAQMVCSSMAYRAAERELTKDECAKVMAAIKELTS